MPRKARRRRTCNASSDNWRASGNSIDIDALHFWDLVPYGLLSILHARVILATEAFLNKECSAGVEAFVRAKAEPVDDEGQIEEVTILSYKRYGGKFRITVTVGTDPDNEETKPSGEWSRAVKLETVTRLPDLIDRKSVV